MLKRFSNMQIRQTAKFIFIINSVVFMFVRRYQKLIKCYVDGTPVEPAEYKVGDLIDVVEQDSLDSGNCEPQEVTPSNPNVWPPDYKNAEVLNLNSWDTSAMNNFKNQFKDLTKLKELHIETWDVSNGYNFDGMFSGCSSLESLNLNKWQMNFNPFEKGISDIVRRSSINLSNMFMNCTKLKSLALNNLNVMFVVNFDGMFSGCSSLESLNLNKWAPTRDGIRTEDMFNGCTKLLSIDMSSFFFDNMAENNYNNMFGGCTALNHIKCKTAFRDWCWTNALTIGLPDSMKEGGSGTWELTD